MEGVYPLSSTEADLRYAFATQHIYLVRDVDVRGLSVPDSCRVESLAFSMVVHGQTTWTQLQRLCSWLPSDKRIRWNPTWGVEDPEFAPSRFTTGAWNFGSQAGMTNNSNIFRGQPEFWPALFIHGTQSTSSRPAP